MSGFHRDITGDQNHVIHFREYADEAARNADTGLDASHLKKVALQLDDNSFWVLVDANPVTWKELAPVPPPPEVPIHGHIEMFWGTINADGRPIDTKTGELDLRYGYCDGRTYAAPDGRLVTTPNMRNRFPMGTSDNGAGKGTTGGASSVTQSTSHMPSHRHSEKTVSYTTGGTGAGSAKLNVNISNTNTGYSGGSSAMENRPPFMQVPFIMYL